MADLQTHLEQQFFLKGRIAGLRAAARRLRSQARELKDIAKQGRSNWTRWIITELLYAARWCEREARRIQKEAHRG